MEATIDLNRTLDRAIQEYDEVGAAVLRNVIDPQWISRLGRTIDHILESRETGEDMSRPGEGRFFGDIFSWLLHPDIEAFIKDAGLAELAGRIMRSNEVRFFYDQIFVKEPGTPKRTPWHQDLPYWPARGQQILSIWVPIDAASPENGVVTYVKGSHRWDAFFPMEEWTDNQPMLDNDYVRSAQTGVYNPGALGRRLADVRDHPECYEFVTWKVEPGDVILHHPLTVHGGPGNLSVNKRRRAIATRWFGDDARWDDSRPHFMRLMRNQPRFPFPKLNTGDRMEDALFPRLWPLAPSK